MSDRERRPMSWHEFLWFKWAIVATVLIPVALFVGFIVGRMTTPGDILVY